MLCGICSCSFVLVPQIPTGLSKSSDIEHVTYAYISSKHRTTIQHYVVWDTECHKTNHEEGRRERLEKVNTQQVN
jgi:hypothetical protein